MKRSRHRSGKTALAASFVVTFAAGCDSKPTAPPVTPTVDVGAPAAPSASAAASAPVSAAPTTPAAPTEMATVPATATALPPAPAFGHVTRRDDGTCMWFADVQCPRAPNGRIMPCNPPPPHRVQCVGDAGP